MTRNILLTTALSLTACAASAETGYMTTILDVAHRDRSVEVHVWYPATDAGASEMLGENIIFKGAPVHRNATPEAGRHPLVLLSHGSGGNAANLSWIADALVARGMVVAAPNHPGSTSRDSLPLETVKIWERPADLSAVLDHALATGFGEVKIDSNAIAAMGFSLGGYSALGIGGAQVSRSDYIDYCDQYAGMHDCKWLMDGGVDFTEVDQARYEQSNQDPRIKAIVSIDPALSQAFTAESLAAMTVPVQLINLGQDAEVPAAVDAANLVDEFAHAELHQIADATHFSFLGRCKRMARPILVSIGEDPICTEPGRRKRNDIHDELSERIGDFLTRVLAPFVSETG